MVRKLNNPKKTSLRRKGFFYLRDDIIFPIYTQGAYTLQKYAVAYERDLKKPKPKRILASEEDKKNLIQDGFKDEIKGRLLIPFLDIYGKEYLDMLIDRDNMEVFLRIAINIDLSFMYEDEQKLFEIYELKDENDYIGMAKELMKMDLSNEDSRNFAEGIELVRTSDCRTYEDFEKLIDEILEIKDKL